MAAYETEEEQIEALKKWWKENGLSVVGGIVIGFALLFGWRWWQAYTEQQSQIASDAYEHILMSIEQQQIQQAYSTTDKLLAEHSDSTYSVLAELNMANQDVESDDIEAAHARLQWVIDQNIDVSEFKHIARLRKARLFMSQGKLDKAINLTANIQTEKFKSSYAELRGDIAIAQGKMAEARIAYSEAVKGEDLSQQHLSWIQMKLDDLGPEKRIEAMVPIDALSTPTTDEIVDSLSTPTTAATVDSLGTPSTSELSTIPVEISELATPQTTE